MPLQQRLEEPILTGIDKTEQKKTIDKPRLFDVKFKLIPETLTSPFTDLFLGYGDEGLVRGDNGAGTVMPAVYGRHADKIFKFQPKKEDTWIVTFPKCGKLYLIIITSYIIQTPINYFDNRDDLDSGIGLVIG